MGEAQDYYNTSTALATAAGLALLAVCSYYLLVGRRRGKAPKRYAPVVGTVFHQLYHVRRLHDYHTDLFRQRKTFQLLVPAGRRQIYTCDPAVVEHILRTNFANYGKVRRETPAPPALPLPSLGFPPTSTLSSNLWRLNGITRLRLWCALVLRHTRAITKLCSPAEPISNSRSMLDKLACVWF